MAFWSVIIFTRYFFFFSSWRKTCLTLDLFFRNYIRVEKPKCPFLSSKKSECSYSQNHWWPMALTVKSGLGDSSIKYNKDSEGKAILIKIIPGTNVHTHSITCPSINPSKMLWKLS